MRQSLSSQSSRDEFERAPAEAAVEEFFEALGAEEPPVAYGEPDADRALEYDAVETLLVAADHRTERIRTLEARVEASGADVMVVPEGLARGERFREAFGVDAVLRFAIE